MKLHATTIFMAMCCEPLTMVFSSDTCLPNRAPFVQSPSCNEGATSKLTADKCCPSCCMNTTGFCEPACNVTRCLAPSSPTRLWSQAYADESKLSFMLVMQRPFKWSVPVSCSCGSQTTPLIHLSGEPILETHPHRVQPGFEESSLRLRLKEREQHGCCTPPTNYEFYTRNLRCTFPQPCDQESIDLIGGQAIEKVAVEIIPRMGGQDGGALICAPRLSRKLATVHLASGYLSEWFSHYASRDAKAINLYSDDCLADVLTPNVLANVAKGLQITVVDISSTREVPAWYHSQLLAMRDCWARGVSGGALWSGSLDLDELLAIPTGWSAAPAFADAHALSFGSKVPCQPYDSKGTCLPTFKGHRKYILKAAPRAGLAESQIVQLLRPPGYIHGDPKEMRLSTDSGMFILHFSRCDFAPFKKRAGAHWIEAVVRDLRGREMPTVNALQNKSSLMRCSNEWMY